ncbi:hypothetical protein [Mycetocola reblochoni]|uniref:Uncharacterized protein n=2 Tax=Mycetocola reblochoni TaxID=331618 RepID=A0A1R4JHL2_9MICO|nr:hypothetical protein [Mycetocola reblochoni]RLP69254.1 hypothetical protein D9V30_08045 [Mycetocola reblochoni]SJN31424.1 hypothetical protein FM119_07550 [Mycetocola reblochoni REB411]
MTMFRHTRTARRAPLTGAVLGGALAVTALCAVPAVQAAPLLERGTTDAPVTVVDRSGSATAPDADAFVTDSHSEHDSDSGPESSASTSADSSVRTPPSGAPWLDPRAWIDAQDDASSEDADDSTPSPSADDSVPTDDTEAGPESGAPEASDSESSESESSDSESAESESSESDPSTSDEADTTADDAARGAIAASEKTAWTEATAAGDDGTKVAERYVRALADKAEVSITWQDTVNGYGGDNGYGGQARALGVGEGVDAEVTLSNSIADDITSVDAARTVAAHEASHVRAGQSQECADLANGGGPFAGEQQPQEIFAQAMTEQMGRGQLDVYEKADTAQIEAVAEAGC